MTFSRAKCFMRQPKLYPYGHLVFLTIHCAVHRNNNMLSVVIYPQLMLWAEESLGH